MSQYVGESFPIRDCLVCVEKRNGISMRRHSTLADLAHSLLYRWPEDHRGKEWIVAQTMCLEAMEGYRDPEQARAAFVAAVLATEMLMVKEEYIQQRPEKPQRKTKGRDQPSPH